MGHLSTHSAACTEEHIPPCPSTRDASTMDKVHIVRTLRICAYFHEEGVSSVLCVFISIKQRLCFRLHALQARVLQWINPPTTSLVLSTLADLTRGKAELLAENALLRQQLIILRRQIKRPVYRKSDQLLLVLLASMGQTWTEGSILGQPQT